MRRTLGCLLKSLPLAALLCMPLTSHGQVIISIDSNAQTRTVSGTTNSRDDNNGGSDTQTIGINPGGVDNFVLFDFDDLNFLPALTLSGDATFSIPGRAFTNNAGSTTDTVNLHELYLTNDGWLEGTRTIVGADNLSDEGSASFLNRVQYNDDPGPAAGTTQPWLDALGNPVTNLLGAVTAPLGSELGYSAADVTAGTALLSFTIDQATAQRWLDDGVGGFLLSATDLDSDGRSRFNLDGLATLTFNTVPEPTALITTTLSLLGLSTVRRKR